MLSLDDKKLLEKKRPELIESIDIQGSAVLAQLRSRWALTPQQEAVIRAQSDSFSQVGKLLDTLLKGDVNTMDKFVYALRCSHHEALVNEYLREPYREDAWDPEELEKVQAKERQEIQQELCQNIENYIKNDPSKILEEAEPAGYINQPVIAQELERGESHKVMSQENVFALLEKCTIEGKLGPRIFIYGAGGMGKSSLCRDVALTWARKTSNLFQSFDYVFPIPMRAIRSHYLVDMICKDAGLIPEKWKKVIKQELELKSVLFILDSFEELSHQTPEINKLIRRELYPKCSVLVTARPGHQLEELEFESTPSIKADLQNLTKQQVKGYMANFPGLRKEAQLGIETKFGMGFLCKPINLWLLCLLVVRIATSAAMPNTQTVLLNKIIQRLMLAYSKKKNLSDQTLSLESPYKKQKLTSQSPIKDAPTEVKLFLKEVGELCYFSLRDQTHILSIDNCLLSKAEVMAMGLFSEGAEDNSVALPNLLFQEYLAALFLSVDKPARQDLFKELKEKSESSSPRPSLVELLRPRYFDNMMRFLVALSPEVAEGLSELLIIKRVKMPFSNINQDDLGYELDLLRECSVKEERSVIAAALLNAPASMRDDCSLANNNDSHLLLHYFNEEQRQVLLRKFYGCQICSHELIQAPGNGYFWLDNFVVAMIYLNNCTVRLEKVLFGDWHVPVSLLRDRLAAVEELTLKDSSLCDLTESQYLASLNIESLFHSSTATTATPPRQREVFLSSVVCHQVKGLNFLSPPHCTLPTTRRLELSSCSGVNLGSLCQCFIGVNELKLLNNKHVNNDNAGRWSSVRKLELGNYDRVDLISLKTMFSQLEELEVNFTALKVEKREPSIQTKWHTVKDVMLSGSHLCTDEAPILEEKVAIENLIELCPQAWIIFEDYGARLYT